MMIVTENEIHKLYFEQMEMCVTADTRASADDRAALDLIATGMRIMAQALIDLVNEEGNK